MFLNVVLVIGGGAKEGHILLNLLCGVTARSDAQKTAQEQLVVT